MQILRILLLLLFSHLMHNLDKKLKEFWHEKTQGGVNQTSELRYGVLVKNCLDYFFQIYTVSNNILL